MGAVSPGAPATSAASRWFERVIAVAIGSLATAWWLRDAGEADPGANAATQPAVAATQPQPANAAAQPAVAASEPTVATQPAPTVAVAASRAPADAPAADPDAPALREPSRAGDPAAIDASPPPADAAAPAQSAGDAGTPALAPTPAGEPPSLPLPRMPGAMRLSDSSRFDAEAGAWVLKAAFRVHARSHHVLSFYRKALEDQGLSVTQADDPPQADGAERTYLHGRSRRVHPQVGLRTRPRERETRVWIRWRARA